MNIFRIRLFFRSSHWATVMYLGLLTHTVHSKTVRSLLASFRRLNLNVTLWWNFTLHISLGWPTLEQVTLEVICVKLCGPLWGENDTLHLKWWKCTTGQSWPVLKGIWCSVWKSQLSRKSLTKFVTSPGRLRCCLPLCCCVGLNESIHSSFVCVMCICASQGLIQCFNVI